MHYDDTIAEYYTNPEKRVNNNKFNQIKRLTINIPSFVCNFGIVT